MWRRLWLSRRDVFTRTPVVLGALSGGTSATASEELHAVQERRVQPAVATSPTYITPQMFGALANDRFDCLPAFQAALKYLTRHSVGEGNHRGSARLVVPAGRYFLSGTLEVKGITLILEGDGTGQAGGSATVLRFPASTCGIRFHRHDTEAGGTGSTASAGADGSIIRQIQLLGGGGPPDEQHSGLWARCRIKVEDLTSTNFAGHGCLIKATMGGGADIEGNANCWRIDTARFAGNIMSGLRVRGADANAGISTLVDASNNGEWGIHDDSFLGNRHDGFHMEANRLGPWKTDGANGFFWMDGYTEPGQPNSSSSPNTLWSGPQFVAVSGAGSGVRANGHDGGGLGSSNGLYARRVHPSGKFLRSRMGPDPQHGQFLAFECNDETGTLSLLTDLSDFFWNINGASPLRITSLVTKQEFGTGGRVVGVVNLSDLYLGAGGAARRQTYASAPPTSGAHAKGEIVWNNGDNPAHDEIDYWRCMTSGEPGKWVPRR